MSKAQRHFQIIVFLTEKEWFGQVFNKLAIKLPLFSKETSIYLLVQIKSRKKEFMVN